MYHFRCSINNPLMLTSCQNVITGQFPDKFMKERVFKEWCLYGRLIQTSQSRTLVRSHCASSHSCYSHSFIFNLTVTVGSVICLEQV